MPHSATSLCTSNNVLERAERIRTQQRHSKDILLALFGLARYGMHSANVRCSRPRATSLPVLVVVLE